MPAIGVKSIDNFTREINDVIRKFGALTDQIEKKRLRIDVTTGFNLFKA